MNKLSFASRAAATTALALGIQLASGQWTVTNLHPAGSLDSVARGVSGSDQVGQAFFGSDYRAARWTGSAGSCIDLTPTGASAARIRGTDGSQQVGVATFGFTENAALWTGTGASFSNLHPLSMFSSKANAVASGKQVGEVTLSSSGPGHAAEWTGSAASFIDRHPAGYLNSNANAATATELAGTATTFSGEMHAAFWQPLSSTFTDLHPSSASISAVNAMTTTHQYGWVNFTGTDHAAIWAGSAGTHVDVNPSGAGGSVIWGAYGDRQVGRAFLSGWKAGIWSGTSASFVNLHTFLPSGYSQSEAFAVWTDGSSTRVTGWAFNIAESRNEAVVWTAVPEPATIASLSLGVLALMRRRGSRLKS